MSRPMHDWPISWTDPRTLGVDNCSRHVFTDHHAFSLSFHNSPSGPILSTAGAVAFSINTTTTPPFRDSSPFTTLDICYRRRCSPQYLLFAGWISRALVELQQWLLLFLASKSALALDEKTGWAWKCRLDFDSFDHGCARIAGRYQIQFRFLV